MARSLILTLGTSLMSLALACCASPTELRQRDEASCASRGFEPGTPDFSACVRQEAAARRCISGPTASLHIKPHAEPLTCRSDPV